MHRITLVLAAAAIGAAQTREQPSRAVSDPGIVTTRQAITPAGVPSVFQGRVYGVAWAGDSGDLWVLHATDLYRLGLEKKPGGGRPPPGGASGQPGVGGRAPPGGRRGWTI